MTGFSFISPSISVVPIKQCPYQGKTNKTRPFDVLGINNPKSEFKYDLGSIK